ncbi:MAG TPA: ATP-dependent RecD-like DNA helicase [Haloplasmataceae bacterium]
MVITGWYKKEIFYNPLDSYHVGAIQTLDSEEMLTIVGYFPKLLKDELYDFYGDYVSNNYGWQFAVESYELRLKNDEESLISFLSSAIFKGIGKKTAQRIVSFLGNDAIDKIINDKKVLDSIPSLNEVKKQSIYEGLLNNYEKERILRFLIEHGFGNRLAMNIFNKYKENTINLLEENPYRLITDIENVGFKKADSFAKSLGFDLKSPYRIQAVIKHVVEEYCFNEGHTYMLKQDIIDKVIMCLDNTISEEVILENLQTLTDKNQMIFENNKYFLTTFYQAEMTIAQKIQRILNNQKEDNIDKDKLESMIRSIEDEENIKYSKKQKEAINLALREPILIITGGPGTGKTTILNGLLKAYIKMNEIPDKRMTKDIALVAPTGRAAKRLSEATGFMSQTIHRLLGYQISGEYTYDENHHLECKLIIIDEASMIDVLLLSQLMKALNDETKIVFVGDVNQLPSVGPGQVLNDLIESLTINTIRLDRIHRQSDDSKIITLAHDINEQIISEDLLIKQKDRNFIRCTNEAMFDNLKFIISNALEKKYTLDNIQVLAPMYKGQVGINNINKYLQECLNPTSSEKRELQYNNKIFRLGDKVIQLVNRPEFNIMNGDIGYIKYIFNDEESDEDIKLIVDYDGSEVYYYENDLNDLALAYCISIHKAQGSEFDIVILLLSKAYSIMLHKKLLYTAVTRAKKYLIILGEYEAYEQALHSTKEIRRKTMLQDRLKVQNEKQVILIDDYEFIFEPNSKINPYQFL